MPNNIDEQVVKLSVDSKSLDRDTKHAINKLDELKTALQFKGVEKGFDNITKAAEQVNLSPIEKGVQAVSNQFDAMATIGTAALFRLTNQAIDAGERMVKSLTIDNVTSGWDKFADKTAAVQTIMAATSKQFDDTGKQMQFVEEQLESLNWFTDETSYKFIDMVNNIGKFTSNSIALDTSVEAMQGISTWAARSGANVNEAGRAMYNLSQALATGVVRLMDWRSIENANMSTTEFKETVLETAASIGILTKAADGWYQTASGDLISSAKGFTDSLQEGWFTSDVLIKSLEKYGGFATELYKVVEETGAETSALLGIIDDYIDGTLDMEEAITITGQSAEELTAWVQKLGSEEMKLGREAFKAAQETKTFQESIDYVKEAVSSGWMRTFENMFGNYEEAKEFWTNVTSYMYDFFVASGDVRNGLLKLWKEAGGRDTFIDGIYALLDAITSVKEAIGDGIREVFPPATVDTLLSFTDGFRVLIDILTPTDLALNSIRQTVSFLANILRSVIRVIKTVASALLPIVDLIDKLAGTIVYLIGNMMELSGISLDNLFNDKTLSTVYSVLNGIAKVINQIGTQGLVAVVNLANKLFGFIRGIFDNIESNGGGIQGIFKGIVQSIKELFQSTELEGAGFFTNLFNNILTSGNALLTGIVKVIGEIVKTITGVEIGDANASGIGEYFNSVIKAIEDSGIQGVISSVMASIEGFISSVFAFVDSLGLTESSIKESVDFIIGELKDLYGYIKNGFADLTFKDIKDIALVIMLGEIVFGLRGLLKSLTVTTAGVGTAVGKLGGVFSSLRTVIGQFAPGDVINKMDILDKLSNVFKQSKILQLTIGIATLVAGLKVLSDLDPERLINSAGAVVVVLGMVAVIAKIMEKISANNAMKPGDVNTSTTNTTNFGGGFAMNIMAIGVAMRLIASAMEAVAYVSEKNLKKAAVVMLGVAALVGVTTTVLNKINKGGITNMLPLVAFAGAILALTPFLKAIGQMEPNEADQGIYAISTIMVSFGAMALMMMKTDWKSLLTASVFIVAMSGAMTILVGALTGLAGLAGGDNLGAAIASLLGLSVALGLLTSLASKAGEGNAKGVLASSAAMIGIATSLTILAGALKILETVKPETALYAIGALLVMLGSAAIIEIFQMGTALQALTTAMIGFGAGAALFGLGVALVGTGIAQVIGAIAALAAAGKLFGEDFPTYMGYAMDGVAVAVDRFLQILIDARPKLLELALNLFSVIVTALKDTMPDILNGIMLLITGILNVIKDVGPDLMDALIEVVDDLTENLPRLMDSIGKFIEALGSSIGGLIRSMIAAVIKSAVATFLGAELTEKLFGKIDDAVTDTVDAYGDKWANDIRAQGPKVEDANRDVADNAADAYIDQSKKREGDFYDVAANQYAAYNQGADDEMGIASPAQTSIDRADNATDSYIDEAAVREDDMAESGKNWAGSFIEGADNAINTGLTNIFNKLTNAKRTAQNMMADIYTGYGDTPELVDPDRSRRQYEKTGKKDAEAYNKSLNEGISGGYSGGGGGGRSGGTSKATKSKAEEISDKFKDALEKIADDEEIADLMYKLWNAQNPQATEMEKAAEEIEYQTAKVHYQLLKTEIAEKKYMETLEAMGATASETHDRYAEMLKEQTSLLELQNKVAELQNGSPQTSEEAVESFQKMSDLISKWDVDWLRQLGFSNEEIGKAAAQQAGYAVPNAIEEKKQEVNSYIYDSAASGVEAYTNAITDGITQATPSVIDTFKTIPEQANTGMQDQTLSFQETGYSFVDAMGVGASTGSENFTTTVNSTLTNTVEQLSTEEAIQPWVTLGINIIDGLIVGVESKSGEFTTKVQQIVNEALAAAQAAAGVASPSTETMWIGEMLDQGLIVGMMNGLPEITDASMTIAQQALEAAMSQLGIASPSRAAYFIGRFFDEGLANGITDYSREVTNASQAMLNQMMKDADLYMSEVVQQAVGLMGYDKNKIPVEFVFESNWAHAKGELSEIERMFYALQAANMAVESAYLNKYDDSFDEYMRKNSDSDMMAHMALEFKDRYGLQTKEYWDAWDKFLEPYQKRWQQLVDESAMRIGMAEQDYQRTRESIDKLLGDTSKQTFGEAKFQFTQNVYAPRQLNTVEIYRMTNNALSKYARKVPAKVYPEGGELDIR